MESKRKIGRSAFGLRAPIIREGDSIQEIATKTVLNSGLPIDDRDILCITESVVARAAGLYATVDEIAQDVRTKYVDDETGKFNHLVLWYPIYSRNRFAICLKGIARGMDKGATIFIVVSPEDEVGNRLLNQVTGIDIIKYYTKICEDEGVRVSFWGKEGGEYKKIYPKLARLSNHLVCPVRDYLKIIDAIANSADDEVGDPFNCYALGDILMGNDKPFGLWGSNKATEEKVKLFPGDILCNELVDNIQKSIEEWTGKKIEVCIYGDGSYHDIPSGILEMLDPVSCPGYTSGLDAMPNEVKIKNLADDKYRDLQGEELEEALKKEAREAGDTAGKMISQGCTPRKITGLVASLADLVSGSGSQGCPFVYIKGYFDNYGDC